MSNFSVLDLPPCEHSSSDDSDSDKSEGIAVQTETTEQHPTASTDIDPRSFEASERQKLSRYLDKKFESDDKCQPIIPIAAKFEDVNGNSYYVRATAWAIGKHQLFTCNHIFEDEKPKDTSKVPALLEAIHWTDPMDPGKHRAPLQILHQDHVHDIAILRCNATFHRLKLQNWQLSPGENLWTVQVLGVPERVVHPGREAPKLQSFALTADTACKSMEEIAGGPVLNSDGRVLGMLPAHSVDTNATVITTQDLFRALEELGKWNIDWRMYGLKLWNTWDKPKEKSPPSVAPGEGTPKSSEVPKLLRQP
ncbi:hypothetical protein ABW21_db0202531 [Orbilia brochopaga]|nr:hypothetical protein ABW21_db0202531 [Drechslerella brochopaga]